MLLIDGTKLAPFEAIDDDAGIYGDITFEILSNNDDKTNFVMFKLHRKQSELRVRRQIEERTYTVSYETSK